MDLGPATEHGFDLPAAAVPTGSLVSGGRHAVGWLGGIGIVLVNLALAFEPGPIQQASFTDNPFGLAGMDVKTYAAVGVSPTSLVFVTAVVLALSSLVFGVGRASGDARLQIKRLTVAFADRLRDEVVLTALALELDATLRGAIAPSSVGLGLRGGRS